MVWTIYFVIVLSVAVMTSPTEKLTSEDTPTEFQSCNSNGTIKSNGVCRQGYERFTEHSYTSRSARYPEKFPIHHETVTAVVENIPQMIADSRRQSAIFAKRKGILQGSAVLRQNNRGGERRQLTANHLEKLT